MDKSPLIDKVEMQMTLLDRFAHETQDAMKRVDLDADEETFETAPYYPEKEKETV